MSNFWSIYIIAITAINIVGCFALLHFTRKKKQSSQDGETTGHAYDGIEEYDNPMPRWWLWLFYITLIFSIGYLVLYPGLGKYQGILGWDQTKQYQEEMAKADEKYLPLYQQYADMSIEALQSEPQALKMGQAIFANTCFGCHGADARGSIGFPNLTDNDWLYGGSPEQIKQSILQGRNGIMPAWAESLSERDIDSVSSYISSKNENKRAFVEGLLPQGKEVYDKSCAACHGVDFKGSQALGAPNLIDSTWLHGASPGLVKDVIRHGRINRMPAHEPILGKEKSHLVAAYVYSLSQGQAEQE
ncbi:cytochrome-c oxidase, cbb3-type subunit III [Kangiella sp. TOML190]|uniref:cytochrome-c oxidase, cbb3-type subunit III n=1 Tax=Kangiella sp. TOML190 TaxID=2931351 RepID=UPI00204095E2|nr:cytochrome-c oxidase, cbb3-type subunit III [Kangiella sp. TOML190]